jgi:hypothetical protein
VRGHRGRAAHPARPRRVPGGYQEGRLHPDREKNQPSLYAQVKNLPWRHIGAGDRQHHRGHGRDEYRTIKTATVAAGLAFPHAAQAIAITRRVRPLPTGKWRTVTAYGITSLTVTQATPADLNRWIRGHWRIENCSADCTYE